VKIKVFSGAANGVRQNLIEKASSCVACQAKLDGKKTRKVKSKLTVKETRETFELRESNCCNSYQSKVERFLNEFE